MGSSKGASGSDKARQRREQQEAARQRKKAAKRGRKQQQPPNFNMIEVTVRFVTRAERYHDLQEAWKTLRWAETLTTYVPAAKHDDWRQKAVGTREFEITLPFELMRRVEREISSHWQRGKNPNASEEEQSAAIEVSA